MAQRWRVVGYNTDSHRVLMPQYSDRTLQFIACESNLNRPGAEMMIAYLSSILLIQAVRTYVASLPEAEGG